MDGGSMILGTDFLVKVPSSLARTPRDSTETEAQQRDLDCVTVLTVLLHADVPGRPYLTEVFQLEALYSLPGRFIGPRHFVHAFHALPWSAPHAIQLLARTHRAKRFANVRPLRDPVLRDRALVVELQHLMSGVDPAQIVKVMELKSSVVRAWVLTHLLPNLEGDLEE